MRPLVDLALDAGTILRLTRFVVLDDLGAWLVRYPAYRWASRKDPHGTGWPTKAVSGLDCPFCCGFWVALLVVATTRSGPIRRSAGLSSLWGTLRSSLALNYVLAHAGARMGDTGADDDHPDHEEHP